MGLWSKLKEIFSFGGRKEKIELVIKCGKCGEEFNTVYRKSYDLQPAYGEEEYDYRLSKQLVCPECYDSFQLELELDEGLKILAQELEKGELEVVSEEE